MMKVIIALFALLAVANAASSALYYAELAHLSDPTCSAASQVGGSAILVAARCTLGVGGFYYGVRCADDNLSVSTIRCPSTDTTCSSTACTVVNNTAQCAVNAASGGTYLRSRCYNTAAEVPVVRRSGFVVTNTYLTPACSGPVPANIYNVPTICSPGVPSSTQGTSVTCTANSVVTRVYNSITCAGTPLVTTTIPACTAFLTNNITTYTSINCYAGNTTVTSSTSGTGTSTGGSTTGPVSSAVFLSASAFVAFIAFILISAF